MTMSDVQDLLDRRLSLVDAIMAGASDQDRPYLDAELEEIEETLDRALDDITTDQ